MWKRVRVPVQMWHSPDAGAAAGEPSPGEDVAPPKATRWRSAVLEHRIGRDQNDARVGIRLGIRRCTGIRADGVACWRCRVNAARTHKTGESDCHTHGSAGVPWQAGLVKGVAGTPSTPADTCHVVRRHTRQAPRSPVRATGRFCGPVARCDACHVARRRRRHVVPRSDDTRDVAPQRVTRWHSPVGSARVTALAPQRGLGWPWLWP
jgi:hypothetical protein